MIATAALVASFGPVLFPARPIAEEIERGARVANRRPGFGIETILAKAPPRLDIDIVIDLERRSLGSWSNGLYQEDVEHATWLSPRLASRWLGFLEAREYWPEGELEYRWDLLRNYLDGRVIWVVQLSAFPFKGSPFNETYRPAQLDDHFDLRFVATVGGEPIETNSALLQRARSQSRSGLADYRWWLEVPFGGVLAPEFKTERTDPGYPLGDWHRAWHLVWCEATPEMVDGFELRVLSERKERVATWGPDSHEGRSRKKPQRTGAEIGIG